MADPEANVIYGIVTDESMGDAVKVTVIATGFSSAARARSRPTPVDLANYVGPPAQRPPSLPPGRGRAASTARRPNAKAASGGGGRLDLDVPAFLRKQGSGGGD